jgi:flagellar hook assembly protein FlgD
VEFVSQLTQFSQLEQIMASRQELTRIREALAPVEESPESGQGSAVQP